MSIKTKVPGILRNMKIAVICGGTSQERRISLMSGNAVYEAIRTSGLRAEKIDAKDNLAGKLLKGRFGLAFIALHGRNGEDGTVQGLLESMKIPYTGSGVMASSMALDKTVAKKLMVFHKILTPEFEIFESRENRHPRLPFPLVVKPAREGSSIGVSIARNKKQFRKAMSAACRIDGKVLVERYVEGRELSVGILDSRPLPVIEIVPADTRQFYDLKAKYDKGGSAHIIPAGISKKQYALSQQLALKTHRVLGCRGVSRTDMILSKTGKLYVLEINTIPGMTRTSLVPDAAFAEGIGFGELVMRILVSALRREDK